MLAKEGKYCPIWRADGSKIESKNDPYLHESIVTYRVTTFWAERRKLRDCSLKITLSIY